MAFTNNILSVRVPTPSDSGASGVGRPCNLRGFWFGPGTADVVVKLHNSTADATGTVLLEIDAMQEGSPNYQQATGMTLPGNGIRFDEGIWVVGAAANTIVGITLFYQ
jgi:hypothetical protein|tara:strand:+ start:422 stop:745 length:324 start_codon:yes stop_codon:yes gene_type:complete